MNQPIMFFSNYCRFSKELMDKGLFKNGAIRTVCIDNMDRTRLPPNMHSVPALYIPSAKALLYGDELSAATTQILSIANQNQQYSQKVNPLQQQGQGQGQGQQQQSGDVLPFSLGGSMGESFSMITENKPEAGENTHMDRNYNFLDINDIGAGLNPTQDNNQTNEMGKLSDTAFERMLKEREKDISQLRKV